MVSFMNFNKTTEYVLRILSFMAMDENRLYRADDIFENLKIPFRYLRKQLTILSKRGLLVSVQGKRGGYKISKNLRNISLFDILQTSGDNLTSNECFFGFKNCTFEQKCAMHDKWNIIHNSLNQVLKSTSLAEITETGIHSFNTKNSF